MQTPVNPFGKKRSTKEDKIIGPLREACFQIPVWDFSRGELYVWEFLGELYVNNPTEQPQTIIFPVEPVTSFWELEIIGDSSLRVGWTLIQFQDKENSWIGNDELSIGLDIANSRVFHQGGSSESTPIAPGAKLITAYVNTAGKDTGPVFTWIADGNLISCAAPIQLSPPFQSSLAFVPAVTLGPMQEVRINVGNSSWRQQPPGVPQPAPARLNPAPVGGLTLLWPRSAPEGLRILRNGLDIGNYSDQVCVLSLVHLELVRLSQIAFEITVLDSGTEEVPFHRKSASTPQEIIASSKEKEGLRGGWASRTFCQEIARGFKRLGDECNSVAYDFHARSGFGDSRTFVAAVVSDLRITAPLHRGLHLLTSVTAVRVQDTDWQVFKYYSDLREKKPNVWNTPSASEFVPTISIPPGTRVTINLGQRPFEVPLPANTVPLLKACGPSAARPAEMWLRYTSAACATCDTGLPISDLAFRCLECPLFYSCTAHASAHGHCMVGLAADALEDWGCTVRDIIPHLDLSALKAWLPELLKGRCGMCQHPLRKFCFVSIQNQLARLCSGCFNEALRVEDPFIGSEESLRHFLVLPLPAAEGTKDPEVPPPSCQLALLFYPDEDPTDASSSNLRWVTDTSLPLAYTSAVLVPTALSSPYTLSEALEGTHLSSAKPSASSAPVAACVPAHTDEPSRPTTQTAISAIPPLRLSHGFPLLPAPPHKPTLDLAAQLTHGHQMTHSFSPRVPGTGDASPRAGFGSHSGANTSPRGPALRHHAPPKPFSDSPTVFYVPKKKKHPPAAPPEAIRRERQQLLQASLKAHEQELDIASTAPPPPKLKYTWAVVPYDAGKDKKH